MALLFEILPGEVHTYPNRVPAHNGGEPLLGWAWAVYFLAVVSFAVVCFLVKHDLVADNLLKFLFELSLLGGMGWYLVHTGIRTVFSAKKKQAWSQFLFFKWNVVPFRAIADIKLRDQERGGKTYYDLVALRRNPYQAPLRISAGCLETAQLGLIQHYAIPVLEEMFPREEETVDVDVEELEVPVERAGELLAAGPAAAPGANADEQARKARENRRRKLKFFKEKDGIYRISLWGAYLKYFAIGALALAASILLAVAQPQGAGFHIPFAIGGGLIALLVVTAFSRVTTGVSVEPANRLFIFKNMLSSAKDTASYNSLIAFNIKDSHLGDRRLCMVLDGVMADPTLCISRSPDTIRDVHTEICAILDIDAKAWFDC